MTPTPPASRTPATPRILAASQPRPTRFAFFVMVLIFSACATGGMKTGMIVGDAVVLRAVYGPRRLADEHLRIVNYKPTLKVSNGDVLEAWGFRHFLISCVLFMVIGAGGTMASLTFLPPAMRRAIQASGQRGKDESPGCLAIIAFFLCAPALSRGHNLLPNAAVIAAAVLLAWTHHALSHQHR